MAFRFRLFILIAFLVQLAPLSVAGSVSAQALPEGVDPGLIGSSVRSELFTAQDALTRGDSAAARQIVSGIANDITALANVLAADPAAAQDLRAFLDDATAAAGKGDAVALASARAGIWTTMLRAAYAEAILAADEGRAADAGAWLLLREFRPTTKFERPNANATLAIRDLASGELSPETAVQEIQADLLDTYQARFSTVLADVQSATESGFIVLQAESTALAAGYWRILAPAYAAQVGAGTAADVEALFGELDAAVTAGDNDAVGAAVAGVVGVDRSFRAAPLSEEDQARRAGQLVRYLSLVPIEYGRGVRNGEVVVDIEIGEAQAFLEGARASFDDLYLTLEAQDPAKTAAVDEAIHWLEGAVNGTASRTSVAEPGAIRDRANDAIDILEGMFPEEWTRSSGQADFDVISSLLDQVETAMKAGQPDLPESARLEAYAIYELGAEKRLLAFAPDLANRTEALFWGGTSETEGLAVAISRNASLAEIHAIRLELDKALDESQERVGAGRPSDAVIVFNAATIVFREGLEAILILASLVASMIGANRKFKKPLVTGAALALLATVILFWSAQTVLQSLARFGEKLEAIVSLVAIGVLLLVMNWFFHKVYWTKWISKHHAQRRAVLGGAVTGQVIGLVILGFTSVFREGAETVLFLQALVLDAGVWVVIQGTGLGLIATAIVGALVLVMQKKLPHKKMLSVTGVMLAFVLVVMVGNTVHVLQVVGWLPIDPIRGVVFPYWMGTWFGLHATWEGIAFQVLALFVVLGSYFAAEWVNRGAFRATKQQEVAA